MLYALNLGLLLAFSRAFFPGEGSPIEPTKEFQNFKEEAHRDKALRTEALRVETLRAEALRAEALRTEVLRAQERTLKSPDFQKFVSELKENLPSQPQRTLCQTLPEKASSFSCLQDFDLSHENKLQDRTLPELYIFVSFSLGEKALLNLAREAKKWGATLVLRGFKVCPHPRENEEREEPGSNHYIKTVQALQKIIMETGQGFIIDPELFDLFSVSAVPTYVLTKPFLLLAGERTQTMPSGVRSGGPLHDRLQGHVSVQYALRVFAKEGELSDGAKALLSKGLLHSNKDDSSFSQKERRKDKAR